MHVASPTFFFIHTEAGQHRLVQQLGSMFRRRTVGSDMVRKKGIEKNSLKSSLLT